VPTVSKFWSFNFLELSGHIKILRYLSLIIKNHKFAWVLKKREEQRLEAAQMKFLRHLLGITKLDKERNSVLGKKQEQRI